METLIAKYNDEKLVTRDGSEFEITAVQLNPVSEQVDTILGRVKVKGEYLEMQWNNYGNALSVVNIHTGNPQQPYQMMQARQFDLVIEKTIEEYAPKPQNENETN